MILDAKAGLRGTLVDADTGRRIPLAVWADTDTGEFIAQRSFDGRTPVYGGDGKPLAYRGRCRLRFVPRKQVQAYRPATAAPLAELRREVLKGRSVRPIVILPGIPPPECQEPKCHRPASWVVIDEQEVDPEPTARGCLAERAVTTQYRAYCRAHYRPPTITSLRGVQSQHEVPRP